jgi:hypothetical protein
MTAALYKREKTNKGHRVRPHKVKSRIKHW